MHRIACRALPIFVVLLACGGSADPVHPDASPVANADLATLPSVDGGVDGGLALDGGSDTGGRGADAGSDGGAASLAGVVSGACGVLDEGTLLGEDPALVRNAIDFPMGFTDADEARLSEGAREILAEGTSGGSSGLSEAFAFEVLHRCEGAELLESETEVRYRPMDSVKTDMRVRIDGQAVGVSVTRAVAFPFDAPYPAERATELLEDKLADVLTSSANVVERHAWVKQILHVVAYGPMHADVVAAAWEALDPALRADTVVWVTVTDGDDAFLY